ncbi:sensor histidine kinase [Georgenia sp. Z1491]|uniref:sensor histidine kinase n=1 Tax=Georgenia sp. Z1491 TaxID=3416707 RepID=UPI003CE97C7C
MHDSWQLWVVALLGLVAGLGAGLALRASDRERDAELEPTGPAPGLDDDVISVLTVLPQSIVVLDADDDVVRASSAAYGFGLVRHDRLAHGRLAEMVARLRRDGQIRDAELALPRGPVDGAGTVHLQVRVAPLKDGRVLLLAEDRTRARRVEDMRRDFVANVSHELKTPVGAIALLAETMDDVADEPDSVRHFASKMETESQRLAELVQDIIDLSRLQEPDALVDPVVVEVDEVVAEAVDRVRVEAGSRGVDIRSGGAQGLRLYGDQGMLTTAVRNLLDNAVRYSPSGSTASVGVSRGDGLIRIAVVDQGPGIPADARERVFERFFRGDLARSRETGGSGLGLSIVKHVAADHGGRAELWSTEGRGSTFTLVLPEAQEPGPHPSPDDEVDADGDDRDGHPSDEER